MEPIIPIRGFTITFVSDKAAVDVNAGQLVTSLELSDQRSVNFVFPINEAASSQATQQASGTVRFALGDDQDATPAFGDPMGHAVDIEVDVVRQEVRLQASLTGFPPIFLYKNSRITVLASSIERLASVGPVALRFDSLGLVEFARIGHPIDHRTLFVGLSLVGAGVCITLRCGVGVKSLTEWDPVAAKTPFANWCDYIAAQRCALAAAVSRMSLSDSLLSLTAGLDTRTILALLIEGGRKLPAFTMSGSSYALDAVAAHELCRAYDMLHTVIQLDRSFVNYIPQCAIEASRRSGGLASLSQAFEVYFYQQLDGSYAARLSGNLGNQVGRSGTEGVSMRGVELDILTDDILKHVVAIPETHWFQHLAADGNAIPARDLIQKESLFASLANASIGSSYMTQQSPYTDRTVITQKLREPHRGNWPSVHPTSIRMRDLLYRFFGEPATRSFQRQVVAQVGGCMAEYPINWGWRATGGMSWKGVALGGLSLLDMAISTRASKHGVARGMAKRLGIAGLSGFQSTDIASEPSVIEFVHDQLTSQAARNCAVLNHDVLHRCLALGLANDQSRSRLLFALDVVLAQQTLNVAV